MNGLKTEGYRDLKYVIPATLLFFHGKWSGISVLPGARSKTSAKTAETQGIFVWQFLNYRV